MKYLNYPCHFNVEEFKKYSAHKVLNDPKYFFQEAFILSKCVVSVDPECDEVFEIMDFYKDAFLLKVWNIIYNII